MALAIREEALDHLTVLVLSGRLDNETAADLELAMSDLVAGGATQFVIDFSELSYISNTGLGALLAGARMVPGNGGMRLAGLSQGVRAVFDAAEATPLFAIFADRHAAIGGQARRVEEDRVARVVARLMGIREEASGGKADPELVARVARAIGA